ncbi:MAG TPA: hypothetical protein ENO08_05610 [Candidatus Eisenbacteria bacterium]|uniref:Choice-of-anchor D domain-containing protein n=1 Tax=Eiseniibacteriota bacterium TaxID=2212470 RepID=A0A7V2AVB5_UNCEI|nr:hypothetical protein [Candidatus Eisenbacteria bacterium]
MRQTILFTLACIVLAATLAMCESSDPSESNGGDDTKVCTLENDSLGFGPVIVGEDDIRTFTVSFTTATSFPYGEIITMDCADFAFWDAALEAATDTFTYESYEYTGSYDVHVQILFEPAGTGEKSCEVDMGSDCGMLTLTGTGIEQGENCLVLQYDYIDFGAVFVGNEKDTTDFVSILNYSGELSIINCPDFSFIDGETGEPTDTLDLSGSFDIQAWSYDTTFTIRFSPATPGQKVCYVQINPDCGQLELRGTGVEAVSGWTWFEQITVEDLHDVYGDADEVYACGDNGVVLRHTHGTPNVYVWMNQGFGGIPLDALWVDESGVVWVGGGEVNGGATYGKAYYNTDGSANWTEFGESWWLDMVSAIWGSSSCSMVFGGPAISGTMNTVYLWDCSELSGDPLGMGYERMAVHGSGPENIWAVLDLAYYNAYHYDGMDWTLTREEWMDQALQDVWVSHNGLAWAVGANGAIYHWTGTAWTDQSIPGETRTIYGVWGLSVNNIYAVGETGLIYHYDGASWSELAYPGGLTETLYAVWGKSAPTIVYMAGTNGTVISYTP